MPFRLALLDVRLVQRERLNNARQSPDIQGPIRGKSQTTRNPCDWPPPADRAISLVKRAETYLGVSDKDDRADDEGTIRRPFLFRLLRPYDTPASYVQGEQLRRFPIDQQKQAGPARHWSAIRITTQRHALRDRTGVSVNPIQEAVYRPNEYAVFRDDQRCVRAIGEL